MTVALIILASCLAATALVLWLLPKLREAEKISDCWDEDRGE